MHATYSVDGPKGAAQVTHAVLKAGKEIAANDSIEKVYIGPMIQVVVDITLVDWGPNSGPGDVAWMLISNPSSTELFVIARNATDFRDSYDSTVLQRSAELGFVSQLNRPRQSYHDECVYHNLSLEP